MTSESDKYPVVLTNGERKWLVANLTDVSPALRGLILGVYLTMPSDDVTLTFSFTLSELDQLDALISKADPFRSKMPCGNLIASLGDKVWYHIARVRAPAEYKPEQQHEEVPRATGSSDDHADANAAHTEREAIRRPGYY